MNDKINKAQIEFGDFQTPPMLAGEICRRLLEFGIEPKLIIEPTCGVGSFVDASLKYFPSTSKVIGIDINQNYLKQIEQKKEIELINGDFFTIDWLSIFDKNINNNILFLGNLPWVTNSKQGLIEGYNLPQKENLKGLTGLDALTGKSNFDISEWMLIKLAEILQIHSGYLAFICKTSVARKLLTYIHDKKHRLTYAAILNINSKKYFNVSIDACLLFCQFDQDIYNYECQVFEDLQKQKQSYKLGYREGIILKQVEVFDRLSYLYNKHQKKWHSGIKHDCSKVMELKKINDKLFNNLGEEVEIEDTYLYPLLKGSDVANGRIHKTNRYLIVTQKLLADPTESITEIAPKTWQYLENHAIFFDSRKSKLYKNSSRFSIFGVGHYSFTPWKIAICGLYKKLSFSLINPLENKPVVFDDTVYFLSFNTHNEAHRVLDILNSDIAMQFLSALIFWDEKRPIKASILNSFNHEVFLVKC